MRKWERRMALILLIVVMVLSFEVTVSAAAFKCSGCGAGVWQPWGANQCGNCNPNSARNVTKDFADSVYRAGEGTMLAGKGMEKVASSVDSMVGNILTGGKNLFIVGLLMILLLIILVFVISMSIKSFSKARNNPHALERLQMKFNQEARIAQIETGGKDPGPPQMTQFK